MDARGSKMNTMRLKRSYAQFAAAAGHTGSASAQGRSKVSKSSAVARQQATGATPNQQDCCGVCPPSSCCPPVPDKCPPCCPVPPVCPCPGPCCCKPPCMPNAPICPGTCPTPNPCPCKGCVYPEPPPPCPAPTPPVCPIPPCGCIPYVKPLPCCCMPPCCVPEPCEPPCPPPLYQFKPCDDDDSFLRDAPQRSHRQRRVVNRVQGRRSHNIHSRRG